MATSKLCRTCQHALCPDLPAAREALCSERGGSHHQSQEAFLAAVSRGCVICTTVRKAIQQRGWPWINGADTDCFSMNYELREVPGALWFTIHYGFLNDTELAVCKDFQMSTELVMFELTPQSVHSGDSLDTGCMTLVRAQPQTSSQSTLDLALQWTINCRERHPECRQLQNQEIWCPTRLVDIDNERGEAWKLVSLHGKLQSSPIYMTLSYRWGPNVKFRLLNGNLRSFQNWQPVRDLPLTFRDAISVARKFLVRFLWIDALCIIQDCREDWAHEAKTMGFVYANALCNLAAVASSDPDGGLFRSRNPEKLRPSPVHASLSSTEPPEHYYAVESEYAERQVFDRELLKRGWVFQERLLCPRILYFAEEQVFWECFVEQRCEAFPNGIPRRTSSKQRDLSAIIQFKKGMLVEPEDCAFEVTWSWRRLVETYTKLELTEASDKLFAMEGIARLFRDCFHDEYLFGLWKTNLVPQLSYSAESPQPRSSSECVAPSWTWASLQSPVRFPSALRTVTDHLSVLDIDLPQRILRLRGHVFQATIDNRDGGCPNYVDLIADNSRNYALMYLDNGDMQNERPENITILPLLSYESNNLLELGCLVLEPILVATVESYRRIGYLKVDRGQDLAFFGITVSEDGTGRMKQDALSDINLV